MNRFTGKKKQFVTRGDYSNIANSRTKILVISQGTFGTLHGIVTCLCTCCTIYRGTHNDVPLNHNWETLQ
jgi:hypothetical protein